jgi:integrase
LAPSTINRYIAALQRAVQVAVNQWGWLPSNPVKGIKKLKEPKGRERVLTAGEKKRLLEACKKSENQHLHTIVLLALATGGRRSEVSCIKWRDLNLKNGSVIFRDTKNGESRTVPLARNICEHFQKLNHEINHHDDDYVFPGVESNDQPIDFRSAWEYALKEAEVKDFRFHDLRHTAATYLARNGATPIQLKHILGHKTLSQVNRYTHISHEDTRSVIENMNCVELGLV